MTKEIKQRIEKIKNGEVPNGYKKTKIGIVPNEWEINSLKNITIQLDEKAGERIFETLSITAGKGFVNQAEKFGKELSGKQYVNYTVINKGDFSYNKGNSKKYPQGCVYMLEDRECAAVPNVFNSFRLKNQCNEFFKQLFIDGFLNKQLYKYINSGVRNDGLLNLYDRDFYSCKVLIPPLNEQQKISEILSTQDKVVELKEKLLKEKEKQKKYLVQSLVTGKKRLKGFNGEWKKVKLGNLMNENNEFVGDRNIKPVAIGVYGIRQREDIFSKDLSKNYSRNKVFKNNQICFGIGTNQIVYGVNIVNKIYCVSPAYKVLDIVNIDPYYLKLLLDINNLRLSSLYLIISARQGKSVDFNGLFNEEFDIPLFEEQKAIAEILTTADKELKLLQEELEEEKRKKKALMQLLLTGIVRVKQ